MQKQPRETLMTLKEALEKEITTQHGWITGTADIDALNGQAFAEVEDEMERSRR